MTIEEMERKLDILRNEYNKNVFETKKEYAVNNSTYKTGE